jgi:hypothetical protein
MELRKKAQYNLPLSATAHFANKNAAICAVLLLFIIIIWLRLYSRLFYAASQDLSALNTA